MKLVPSLASANQTRIADELSRIGDGYLHLHLDIEDGNFIDNITFGMKMVKEVRAINDKAFSLHLMVSDPLLYLDELKKLDCSHIFIHVEKQLYLRKLIYAFKETGAKIGLALNPLSSIKDYEYLLEDIDAILYMTCEPDGKGQVFNERVLKKVVRYPDKELWLDGGIKQEHFSLIETVEPDFIVVGRALFGHKNPEDFLRAYNV